MIKFLLQDVIFDDIEKAKYTLEQMNYEYIIYENNSNINDLIKNEKEIIPFLSIQNCNKLLNTNIFANTVNFYDRNKYNQTDYMKYFGEYMLNNDCIFLPFSEVKRRNIDWFNNTFQSSDIFIRPNSGSKTFTGQVLKIDDWENELDIFNKTYKPFDTDLVSISSAKSFTLPEFRFWVTNKVITYSCYSFEEFDYTEPDQNMIDFVNDFVAPLNEMEDMIVVDIVSTGSFYSIVEINCVNTSGTYSCDLKLLFSEMANILQRKINDT